MTYATGHFLFLGTGASMGVPVIGCTCPVCLSTSPYNKRFRPSALVTIGDRRFLIDCGPEFKQQALCYRMNTLDGVILTHAHNDHVAGIDDLKIYSLRSGQPLPCLLSEETLQDLKRRFYYFFEEGVYEGLTTRLKMQLLIEERGNTVFQGVRIRYFSYEQAGMKVNGFRFGTLAYVSDIRHYPETIFADLKGVNTLILSTLRFASSDMHLSVDEAIDFAARIGAEKTWLMHISHDLDHDKTNAYLPENIQLAYDGLQLEFEADIV